jgi:hypothetical protein
LRFKSRRKSRRESGKGRGEEGEGIRRYAREKEEGKEEDRGRRRRCRE